jgi:hypothetical protein
LQSGHDQIRPTLTVAGHGQIRQQRISLLLGVEVQEVVG